MNIKIYKPFSPSAIKDYKVVNGTAIEISCGGGMGGAHWIEYTTNKVDTTKSRIIVDTNRTPLHDINTNFIVSTYPVKILQLTIVNKGNQYMGIPMLGMKNYYFVCNINDTFKVIDDIGDNPRDNRIDVYNENFVD